ncbi:MAG TPA: SDR family oxidoreductase [Anaerolineales bacterium]|nr:SDR family oxidoreductase [Anaerolineales bacterium]
MDLNLKNKIAIVTGASRGIGKSIAQTLSAEGVKLTLVARSPLDEFSASLPTESLPLSIDLRQPDAASRVVEATLQKFGGIDILVNNAGATKRGDFLQLTDDEWTDGFALKFYGAMRLSRAAWTSLMQSKGSIVNIIGIGGRTGSAEFAIGGTVNAALMNLTKVLADRGIKDGVRVNAINPGSIATERLQTRVNTFAKEKSLPYDEAFTQMAKNLGIARFGEPEEIARAVAFLVSPQAAYIHGAVLDIDGGATKTL